MVFPGQCYPAKYGEYPTDRSWFGLKAAAKLAIHIALGVPPCSTVLIRWIESGFDNVTGSCACVSQAHWPRVPFGSKHGRCDGGKWRVL